MNPKKSSLFASEVECLGHIVKPGSIYPMQDKLHEIKDWHTPQNLHDVQRFLGLVNYLRRHLPNLAKFSTPPFQLL